MRHGSLFSGIGGFDLAAEWMGWENVFHCEWNEFGQKVLKHYWPNAESFGDITKTNFSKYYGTIDIISGGFPCQPYSAAGKRLGKEDERHLWPEMLRAIREIAPRYVVGENVRGLTNWNGGMVFDEVCTDLENLGYQVTPYLIPAVGVNAPHKRERVWFVAYNSSERLERSEGKGLQRRDNGRPSNLGNVANASDTERVRLQIRSASEDISNEKRETRDERSKFTIPVETIGRRYVTNQWENFPTQSPICSGDDGIPRELDGITFSKWRNESIKAYGNAVVPQVIYQIFKSIQAYENIL